MLEIFPNFAVIKAREQIDNVMDVSSDNIARRYMLNLLPGVGIQIFHDEQVDIDNKAALALVQKVCKRVRRFLADQDTRPFEHERRPTV